jgi:hypothetical protein
MHPNDNVGGEVKSFIHSERIVCIETPEYKGKVYNLTVDGSESYVANGISSHNCGCVVVRVPAGWGFDEEGDLVPGGAYGKVQKSVAFVGPRGGMWADAKHTIPWKGDAPHGVSPDSPRHGIPRVKEAQVKQLVSDLTDGVKESPEGLIKLKDLHHKTLTVTTGGRRIKVEVLPHPDGEQAYFGKIEMRAKDPTRAIIKLFVPSDATTKKESAHQALRTILSHELTHAVDPGLKQGKRSLVPQSKLSNHAYVNQPAEVAAHMQQVYRELHDLQATKDSQRKDIGAWAIKHSSVWKRIAPQLSHKNKRKAMKLIVGWWEKQQAGTHETILKARIPNEFVESTHPSGATNTRAGAADTMSWFTDLFEFDHPPVVAWDYSNWLRTEEPKEHRKETPETYTALLEYDTTPTTQAAELGKVVDESEKKHRHGVKDRWERLVVQMDRMRAGQEPVYRNPALPKRKPKID